MMDENKDTQRREFIFKLLDDMKAGGERITADKLAKKAKMGKQTVLPHYNEWRYLGTAEIHSDVELPEDLVRVLKRGLIEWRIAESQKQNDFEELTNKEIDDLKDLVTRQTKELAQRKEEHNTLLDNYNDAQRLILNTQEALTKAKEQRIELEARYESEVKKSESMADQIAELKQEHLNALEHQEKKLDNQYQSQINHWMKMVDNERRLRTDVETRLEQQKVQTQSVEKKHHDLEYRLEAKSRAYLDACEDRNQLRQKTEDMEPLLSVVNELSLLLNESSSHLTKRVRSMMEDQQHTQTQRHEMSVMAEKLAMLEEQAAARKQTEIELEKQRGYCEAMEAALEKALNTEKTNRSKSASLKNESR